MKNWIDILSLSLTLRFIIHFYLSVDNFYFNLFNRVMGPEKVMAYASVILVIVVTTVINVQKIILFPQILILLPVKNAINHAKKAVQP